jgi:Na+/melibiose symporter-like transporter
MHGDRGGADRLWSAYGVGHYGKSLLWHGSELLFAFYLTEVCGLAPSLMATVVAAALFASGLMDVAVGHYLRARVRTVFAAATVQLWGAAAAGIGFSLFMTIGLADRAQALQLALVLGMAFRLAYAFYDVPQNAILGLGAMDGRQRTRLSSLRFICSGLASLSIAATTPLLLTTARQPERFAAVGAIICLISIGSSAWFLWVSKHGQSNARAGAPAELAQAQADAGTRPDRTLLLLGAGFVVSASSVVFMKLEPYFAAYLLPTPLARGMVLTAIACGGIASQFVAVWIAGRWHAMLAFRVMAAILGCSSLAFALLGARHVEWAALAGFAVGFGLSGVGMLVWSAMGNLAAALAIRRHSLSPTMLFGMLTFTQKSASAAGTIVIGVTLNHHLEWERGASASPILWAMGLAPLLGALVCLLLARPLLGHR